MLRQLPGERLGGVCVVPGARVAGLASWQVALLEATSSCTGCAPQRGTRPRGTVSMFMMRFRSCNIY
jgi:hypothetical protein